MEEFAKALLDICPRFRVDKLYAQQEDALVQYVCKRRDVFVNLPTGYGKSMIFQMAPFIASKLSNFSPDSIIVVISPLVALMKDQVSRLTSLDISAAFVTADQEEEVLKRVENGLFRIVRLCQDSRGNCSNRSCIPVLH